jgi:RNA polymerase subunit RPABC4/transcription elongation factor Spt4
MINYRLCPECGRRTAGPSGCLPCLRAKAIVANAAKPRVACADCGRLIPCGRWCPACYSARKAAGRPLTAEVAP